jgi:hypothetical protein
MVTKSSLDLLQKHIAAIQKFLNHIPFALHILLNPHHDSALTFATGPHVDLSAIGAAQWSCPDIALMQASPSISVIYGMVGDVGLQGDISTGVCRPFVPAAFRNVVCAAMHCIHHPGVCMVNASYCWPKMGVSFLILLALA